MKRFTLIMFATAGIALGTGCPPNPNPPPPPPPVEVDETIFANALGEPMAGATAEELETFERGREVALKRFDSTNGLGPDFNVTFCTSCHEKPVFGGSGPRYRDFFIVGTKLDDGSFIEGGKNGVQVHFSLEEPYRLPTDEDINHMTGRNAIPFFGVGALAAIDEDAILANSDPDDADGDGISGRPNYDRGFVGRFGRKSQTVSIEGFIRGPLFNHLGVTTDPLSNEKKAELPIPSALDETMTREMGLFPCFNCQAAAPDEPNSDEDATPDPEMTEQELFDLVSFAMLLGAPTPDEKSEQAAHGEVVFEKANCSACHVPALQGPNGMIPAYSDLLLHDMGDELADGLEMGDATGNEFRTQPLWGVGSTGPYLHDGRASTLDEAIRMHGGEAEASRDAYLSYSEEDRADVIAFLESLGGASQKTAGLEAPDSPVPGVGEYGGPRQELSDDAMAEFTTGRALFDRDFHPEEGLGLGAGFNGDSCRACHFDPVIGGAGPLGVNVTRQGIVDPQTMEYADSAFGSMLHHHSTDISRPSQDPLCNVIELRQTPSILGLGLVDEIPEEDILSRADPDDEDGDGISGRAHMTADGRVGRFGWKGGIPTLEDFVRDAVSNEIGLTLEDSASFIAGVAGDDDDVTDPEFGGPNYGALVFYAKMLAPPPRAEVGDAEQRGEQLFGEVGCADCHTPEMTTADGEAVPLYSDLLLHDVAPEGFMGIADGMATMREFRTPPLWGLSTSAPYMHDGLAPTIGAAILRHAAEGQASKAAFEALTDAEREDLIAFLESL